MTEEPNNQTKEYEMPQEPIFEITVKVSMQDIIENVEIETDYDSDCGVSAYLDADAVKDHLRSEVVHRICNSFDTQVLGSIRQLAQAEIKEKIELNASKLVDDFFKEKTEGGIVSEVSKKIADKVREEVQSQGGRIDREIKSIITDKMRDFESRLRDEVFKKIISEAQDRAAEIINPKAV